MSENNKILFSRRFILFVLIYSLIQIAALLCQFNKENYFTKDSNEYLYYANNLKSSGIAYCGDISAKRDPLFYTQRIPGYPVFINFIAIFNEDFKFLILIQSFLSIIFAAITYLFYKTCFSEKVILPIFISACIFTPSQFIYPLLIMTESLFQIFFVGSLFTLLLFMRNMRTVLLIFSMILISISVVIKPVASLTIVLIVPLVISAILKNKLRRIIIVASFIPILTIITLSAWNYSRTKSFSVSSIGSTNIMRYYTYMFLTDEKGESYAEHFLDECISLKNSSDEAGKVENYYLKRSFDEIQRNPVKFLLLNIKGWSNFFLDFGRYDLSQILNGNKEKSDGLLVKFSKGGYSSLIVYMKGLNPLIAAGYILMILFNLINLLSFCFYLFFSDDSQYAKIACAIYIFSIMIASSAIGASRFRYPIFPIMIYAMAFNFNAFILKREQVRNEIEKSVKNSNLE